MSAFGAQSVPENAPWMHPEQWPDLDWDSLAEHHGLEPMTPRHATGALQQLA